MSNLTDRRALKAVRNLEKLEKDYLHFRDEAIAHKRWNQIAVFDGIATGLQHAQGTVRFEFNMRLGRKRK